MKRKIIIIFIWILIWQIAAWIIRNPVVFAGPWETLQALGRLLTDKEFYPTICNTMLRILLGMVLGTGLGFLLAYTAKQVSFLQDVLSPMVGIIKATPVASFVILLLIWFGSRWTAAVVVFLVTFPIAYLNLLKGLGNMDVRLSEMADLYQISPGKRFRYVEFPQVRGNVAAALSLAVGMGFKSGIAAEVIGQAGRTIGNSLYRAKIYLETDSLFAWTVVVILLSWGVEKLLGLLLKRAGLMPGG